MLSIGTILSVVGTVSDAIGIYKFVSTLAKGGDTERVLGALGSLHAKIERLNDHILYAPGIAGLSDTTGAAHRLNNLRDVRELLEPVQAALGGEIVSSGLIATPAQMERAMLANPWAVLEDVRPQHLAARPANPDKVPVLFVHQGVRYIGWQMRGALPMLFNCELSDLPGLGTSLVPDARETPRAETVERAEPAGWAKVVASANDPLIRTFTGHGNQVHSVAYSPDGRTALSGSWDKTLKLWDVTTGRELRTFTGHGHSVHSVAYSPDGRTALSGSPDNTLKLWDVATGRELRTFTGHRNCVRSVAYSPDGRTALSGGDDKTLKLWDVATGRELRTFTGHGYRVYSVAYSPDGRTALSGSEDKTLRLWDVATGRELRTFTGHGHYVYSVAYSPDGRTALSGSWDKTLKLWDVDTGRELRTFTGYSHGVSSVAYSPDGCTALSGSGDTKLKLWDVDTGRELRTFTGHSNLVWSVANSPDGRTALSGSADNTLKLWDLTPFLPHD